MLDTLGIIEIPQSSLCNCFFQRRLGGVSVLQNFVRQVTDSQLLDGVVVAVGDSVLDQRAAELVPADVPVFCGAADVLKRFVQVVDKYPASSIVRVCVDHLFVDPVLIDRLISTAQANTNCDYLSYCSQDGKPTVLSSLGLFAEWCDVKALRKANRHAVATIDRQQPTHYIYSHPEDFQLKLIPVPKSLDRLDVRLTVNDEEDWDNMEQIYDALGEDSDQWQCIADLLEEHPEMRQKMAKLNEVSQEP